MRVFELCIAAGNRPKRLLLSGCLLRVYDDRVLVLDRHIHLLLFFIDRYAESYRRELDLFVQAVEIGAPPPIGVEDGRRALMIAEAGVRSAKTGMPVALQA